jgi:hypothetical protein
VVIVVVVSCQTAFNHHLRYILPAFPFLFIATGRVGALHFRRSPCLPAVCSVLLGVGIISSLSVYPHSLSYFNESVGGPAQGHKHLLDSNIDWGQDLLYLQKWMNRHPEAKPVGIAYFGMFDPSDVGIKTTPPPQAPKSRPVQLNEIRIQPGWYAVSVNKLYGYRSSDCQSSPDACYKYFMRFRPADMVGYSIFIYHLTEDDVSLFRK